MEDNCGLVSRTFGLRDVISANIALEGCLYCCPRSPLGCGSLDDARTFKLWIQPRLPLGNETLVFCTAVFRAGEKALDEADGTPGKLFILDENKTLNLINN